VEYDGTVLRQTAAGWSDYAKGIAVDAGGTLVDVAITTTPSIQTPANNTLIQQLNGGTGAAVWARALTASSSSAPNAVAIDAQGNVIVVGTSIGSGGNLDYVAIKLSSSILPIHLAIERDGSGGFFIRFTGEPDVTYRLQRAPSVTGPWSTSAPQTAPASGLIEFHDLFPPPGQAFYRTVQP